MIRFLKCQRLSQFIRYKSSDVRAKRLSRKDALPKKAEEKIKMWKESLKHEIETHLSTSKTIKNLTFRSFNIDPTGGNIINLGLPHNVKMDEIRHYFRPGAWIDLTIGENELTGFSNSFTNESIQLRLKDVPPPSIYDKPKISVSLPDDRFVLDFLLELWTENDWRKLPGAKNFLKAHYADQLTFGRPRGKVKFINQNLDASQRHAVDLSMHPMQKLLSIQGPPGTGKTDVVAEIVMQHFRKNKNVLVLAPSNKAVDNVAERVYKLMNTNDDRQFRLSTASESPFALKDAINSHRSYQKLESICDKNTQFWDHEKIGQRGAREARDLYDNISTDIISNANVIYSTFTAGSVRKLKKRRFTPDVVVIDEAGQAPECLAWFGILQAQKAIIVGDQHQLGPVVRSEKAMEVNFGNSVMNYLYEEFGNKVQTRLQTQYRSNEKIMYWSSDIFYDGELEADESVRNISVKDLMKKDSNCYTDPLILIDSVNADFHERRVQTSYMNEGEAKIVEEQVRSLINGGLNARQIGVISPYRGQVEYLRRLLADIPGLAISSVDAFQGRECEVVCMSLVRSRSYDIELGFLTDLRRMNVSITRSKRQFFLCANSDTMKENKELKELLNVITKNGIVVKLAAENRKNSRSLKGII